MINALNLNESSYDFVNYDNDCEFLIIQNMSTPLVDLPLFIKEIWLSNKIDKNIIERCKIPFDCELKYY